MASPSGNSSGSGSGSSKIHTSGSEEDLLLVDQRKRKRMQSNRDSARRSRLRKQKHLDDLVVQANELRKENHQILNSINVTTQHFDKVESENSILRARMAELSQRLQSLNEILSYINNNNTDIGFYESNQAFQNGDDSFINPTNMLYHRQPIMASADMFPY